MRVAIFSAALPQADRKPGGVDIYISRLADHLQAAGHPVCVYSYSPSPKGASFDHVRLRPHGFANSALARMSIVPLLLNRCDFDGDVLHLHSDDWFLTRRDLPTVRTFHGSALYEAMFAARWRRRLTQAAIVPLEMRAARLATARFGVAPGTETWLHLDGHLPGGVEGPAAAPTPAESPTVLFVGTWAGRKRGAFLHRIFTEEVVHRIPNAQLWMVSDHCVETDRVRWFARPSDDELGELYSRAWVLAAPSLYEGFGLYYLEAMASETMVVASPNPGSMYVLDQGRAGRLVQDDNFGRTIAEALENDDMRAGYVARGRERAGDFSWTKAVEDHIQAYELAIERWSRRRSSGLAERAQGGLDLGQPQGALSAQAAVQGESLPRDGVPLHGRDRAESLDQTADHPAQPANPDPHPDPLDDVSRDVDEMPRRRKGAPRPDDLVPVPEDVLPLQRTHRRNVVKAGFRATHPGHESLRQQAQGEIPLLAVHPVLPVVAADLPEDVRPRRVGGTRVRRQDPEVVVGGPSVALALPAATTSLNGIATMATRGWSKSATVWVIVALEVKRASSSRWTTMLLPARLVMRLRLTRRAERLLVAMKAHRREFLANHLAGPIGRRVVEDDDLRVPRPVPAPSGAHPAVRVLRFRVTSATVTGTLRSSSGMAGQSTPGKEARPGAPVPWSDLAAKSSNVQRFLLRVARHLGAAGNVAQRRMAGTRYIRRSEWLLAVALSLLAAGALVYGVAVGVRMPAGIAALILALLSILIASRSLAACRARLRAGGGFSRLGSAIFGAGILIAVILPGVQLVLNTRKSRLGGQRLPDAGRGSRLSPSPS